MNIKDQRFANNGSKNGHWKGGRFKNLAGYIEIYDPSHPNVGRKGKYVMEHIKIMAEYLKRPLLPQECVHHRNGIKDDNRIENLELRLINNHPKGQSISDDLVPWAWEIINRYDPQHKYRKGEYS